MARNNGNVPQQKKGFGALKCPRCLTEGTIYLSLEDLQTFKCDGYDCDGSEFTLGDVRELLSGWQNVMLWIEQKDLYTPHQAEVCKK